jgi:hypothetical protein
MNKFKSIKKVKMSWKYIIPIYGLFKALLEVDEFLNSRFLIMSWVIYQVGGLVLTLFYFLFK